MAVANRKIAKDSEIETMLELAKTIAPDSARSPFETSLGVGDDCLTTEDLMDALLNGITGKNAIHFRKCVTCVENVDGLHRLAGLSKMGKAAVDDFSQGATVPAILAMAESRIAVPANSVDESFRITCDIIPLLTAEDELDLSSIQVSGAMVASQAEVETLHFGDGAPDAITLTVDASLANRVKDGLRNHQEVIDTMRVSGKLLSGQPAKFVGQVSVGFFNPEDKEI